MIRAALSSHGMISRKTDGVSGFIQILNSMKARGAAVLPELQAMSYSYFSIQPSNFPLQHSAAVSAANSCSCIRRGNKNVI